MFVRSSAKDLQIHVMLNFEQTMLGSSSTKIAHTVLFQQQKKHGHHGHFLFLIGWN